MWGLRGCERLITAPGLKPVPTSNPSHECFHYIILSVSTSSFMCMLLSISFMAGKVKLSLSSIKHHAMKEYGGVDVDPRILDHGTRWR
jgi:hypothetical protein